MMETATDSLAIGVNLIVKNFLITQMGENPKEMKTEIAADLAMVLVRDLLPPAEVDLLEKNGMTIAVYQQMREQLFKKSEHILRAKVADFLQRRIKDIHYIFGTRPEDMNIIIYLEPSSARRRE